MRTLALGSSPVRIPRGATIPCPICGLPCDPKGLWQHLRGKEHGIPVDEAKRMAKKARLAVLPTAGESGTPRAWLNRVTRAQGELEAAKTLLRRPAALSPAARRKAEAARDSASAELAKLLKTGE